MVKEAKQKNNHILYILQCKYGILENGYLVKEMEKYLGVIELPAIESYPVNKKTGLHEYPKISLRSAAALASNHTTDLRLAKLMCNCNRPCDTKHCKCYAAGKKCTSHCHNKLTSTKKCKNL